MRRDNKKARFNFTLFDTYTAGIVLSAYETKAVHADCYAFNDAFCYFKDGELYLKNFHIGIPPNYQQDQEDWKPLRERKLLLNKKELNKIQEEIKLKKYTVVPVSIFRNDKSKFKLDIALAKGKKMYDKRQSIKEREYTRKIKEII